ncbi:hypothetical protein L914_04368 [Phytophthora nicotianae]|uniref:Ubiquitin-like protease family profile domain-containing protein n=1 Tax=Phytophthora nicotianae TaxID=4792 RepID=W2NVA5_PHYNI|nr:hypothetical protein L914_04368 [Phytophthora nicotianae]
MGKGVGRPDPLEQRTLVSRASSVSSISATTGLQSNLTSLKNAVRTVVETMLNMTDRIQFDVISGCKQMDNSSCGLWCLVVLELLLFGATLENWSDYWSDSLYEEVVYLRMRYLHKVIRLQGHLSVDIDEVSE